MLSVLKAVAVYGITAIILAGAAVGGVYLYRENSLKGVGLDSAAQAAHADAETQARAAADIKLHAIVIKEFPSLEGSIQMTNVFFANPTSDNPHVMISTVSKDDATKIDTLRKQVNTELDALHTAIDTFKTTTEPNPQFITQLNHDIVLMQQYLDELETISNNLTESASLTQTQITDIQNTISTAQQTLDSAATTIATTETTTGVTTTSDTTYTTIPDNTQSGGQTVTTDQTSQTANSTSNTTSSNTSTTDTTSSNTSTTVTSTSGSTGNDTTTTTSSGSGTTSGTSVTTDTSSTNTTVISSTTSTSQPTSFDPSSAPRLIEGANKY